MSETNLFRDLNQQLSVKLDALYKNVTELLARCDPDKRQDLLAKFTGTLVGLIDELDATARQALRRTIAEGSAEAMKDPVTEHFQEESSKLSPEILDWARQQSSEEEIVAGLREIRQTGGVELKDFIHELEQAAADA